MRIHHVVWAWNGTLLDDVVLVAQATTQTLHALGVEALAVDEFRAAYRRPIHVFYEHLLGRALGPGEFERLDREFHEVYEQGLDGCTLFAGVEEALDAVQRRGWTQSICSMYPHADLQRLVTAMGIAGNFVRMDGVDPLHRGGLKADHLHTHLNDLGIAGEHVVVIGDSLDDAEAARTCGAAAVLLTTGLHHREDLAAIGVPVAESVLEALDLVTGGAAVAAAGDGL
jgi:phosphoglycolate phosphatase-like HAD superfamily hydrolase